MNRRKSLSFAGTAFLTWPIFRLPVLVLATSLVLAGQSNAADTRATDIHLATADPVPDNKARVERPAPIVPVVIALGDRTSVLTYWVDEPDGFHVITTVDTVSRMCCLGASSVTRRLTRARLFGRADPTTSAPTNIV